MLAAALLLALAFPARRARAGDLDDAEINAPTVVQTWFADGGGFQSLPDPAGSGTVRLALKSLDLTTLHETRYGHFTLLAKLRDARGDVRSASLSLDLGGTDWRVEGARLLGASEASRERGDDRLASSRQAFSGKFVRSGPTLPDLTLPELKPDGELETASCPAKKCLTIVVAPWCPHCHKATPGILKLRPILKKAGIPVRVVVGSDDDAKVAAYAETFGPDTALDPKNTLQCGGIPHFYVTVDGGRILSEKAGAPEDGDGAKLAAYLGLP
jgi:thiol-disulfide isomerase/thioredoxin